MANYTEQQSCLRMWCTLVYHENQLGLLPFESSIIQQATMIELSSPSEAGTKLPKALMIMLLHH